MRPISGVGFCGPRSRPEGRSLRSSAPPPDLGHLDDESLADYLTDALADRGGLLPAALRPVRIRRLAGQGRDLAIRPGWLSVRGWHRPYRSEERRVGKEGRCARATEC